MRTLCLVTVVLHAACGSVTNDGEPDAGGGDDTTAPAIESTSPSDGEAQVSILSPITVVMDEPIDPATAGQYTIVVADQFGGAVNGTVSVDGNTITFEPDGLLTRGRDYSVTVGAVSDQAGNASTGASLGFTTFVNGEIHTTQYNDSGLTSWTEYELDAAGHWYRRDLYTGPGVDGEWLTDDDDESNMVIYEYADHQLREYTLVYGPGPDGQWGTDDDENPQNSVYFYDELDRSFKVTNGNDPGDDGQWGTNDDTMSSYVTYGYLGDTRTRTTTTIYDSPGPDDVWETSDDAIDRHLVTTFDNEDLALRFATFNGAGPDGVWHTGDDDVYTYQTYTRDADGHHVATTYYNSAGNDGQWFTADDVSSGYMDNERDASGRLDETVRVTDPGSDGLWRTADDVLNLRTVYEYDANGQSLLITSMNDAGADGLIGTTDDGVSQYVEYDYAANGNTESSSRFNGAGQDGVWFNSDDLKQTITVYDTTL